MFSNSRWVFVLLLLTALLPADAPLTETKVIVLGIAQDGGIPQIGCTQEICRTQHHFVTSLAILHRQSIYLIDATPDLRQQYQELVKRHPQIEKNNLFDGIFLTHAHMGHYTGLMFLGKESISTKNTPVYCSKEMSAFLSNNAPWSLLVSNKNIELKSFEASTPIDLGFKITALPVPHRKEFTDTYGFLIEGQKKTLLYIPDIDAWEPVQDSLQQWFQKSNFALLDGTFYSGDELPGRNMKLVPHPTVEHSISLFQGFPKFPAEIFFTHLNHTNPLLLFGSPQRKALAAAGYQVAVDWQEFSL
jgi:pyrroloquinoline quinone biosynthesis protein B